MKIAQIMVNDFEDVEALTTIDLLRRANIEIDTIALYDKLEIKSAHNVEMKCDKKVSDVKLDDYDGYILPGGPGTNLYYKSELLKDVLKKANQDKKLIAAICAAPSYLADLGILKNHKATSFPSVEAILIDNDVKFEKAKVVVEGNFITAQALGSAIDFSLQIIEYVVNKEKALDIREEIYY